MLNFERLQKNIEISLKCTTDSYCEEVFDVYTKALQRASHETLEKNKSSYSKIRESPISAKTLEELEPFETFYDDVFSTSIFTVSYYIKHTVMFGYPAFFSILYLLPHLDVNEIHIVVPNYISHITNPEKNCNHAANVISVDILDPNIERRNRLKITTFTLIRLLEMIKFLKKNIKVFIYDSIKKAVKREVLRTASQKEVLRTASQGEVHNCILFDDKIKDIAFAKTIAAENIVIFDNYSITIFKNANKSYAIAKYSIFEKVVKKLKEELKENELETECEFNVLEYNNKIFHKRDKIFSNGLTNYIFQTSDYNIISSSIEKAYSILYEEISKADQILFSTSGYYSYIFKMCLRKIY